MRKTGLLLLSLSLVLADIAPSSVNAETMGEMPSTTEMAAPEEDVTENPSDSTEKSETEDNSANGSEDTENKTGAMETTDGSEAEATASEANTEATETTDGNGAKSTVSETNTKAAETTDSNEADSTASEEDTEDSKTTDNSGAEPAVSEEGTEDSETTEEDQTVQSLPEDFLKIQSIAAVRSDTGITVTMISQNSDFTGIYFGKKEDSDKSPVITGEMQTDGTILYEFTMDETKAGQTVYYVPLSGSGEWYTDHDLILQLPQIEEPQYNTAEEEQNVNEDPDTDKDSGVNEDPDTDKDSDTGSDEDPDADTDSDASADPGEDPDADTDSDANEDPDEDSDSDTNEAPDDLAGKTDSSGKQPDHTTNTSSGNNKQPGTSGKTSGSSHSDKNKQSGSGSGSSRNGSRNKKGTDDAEAVPDDLITAEDAPEITGYTYLGTEENESARYFRIHYYDQNVKVLEISLNKEEPIWSSSGENGPYEGNVLRYVIVPEDITLSDTLSEHMIVVQSDLAGVYIDFSGSMEKVEEMAQMGIPVLIDRSSAEKDEKGQQEWIKVYQLFGSGSQTL